jgi:hypothetical protein
MPPNTLLQSTDSLTILWKFRANNLKSVWDTNKSENQNIYLLKRTQREDEQNNYLPKPPLHAGLFSVILDESSHCEGVFAY